MFRWLLILLLVFSSHLGSYHTSYTNYNQASWIDDFTGWVLQMLGLQPTPWRQQFLQTWAQFETGGGTAGTGLFYNPFGTTFKTAGATPNVGGQENVWHFPTAIEGAYATAQTIVNYPTVVATLQQQAINNPTGLQQEIAGSWGTGGFATLIGQRWTPDQPGNVSAPVSPIPPRTFLGETTSPNAPPVSGPTVPATPPPASVPSTPPRSAVTPPTAVPVAPRAAPTVPPQIIPPAPAPVAAAAAPVLPMARGGVPMGVIDVTPGAGIPQTLLTQGKTNVIQLHENIDVSRLQGWNAYTWVNNQWTQVTNGAINGIVALNPAGAGPPVSGPG